MPQVLQNSARPFKIYFADDADPAAGKTGVTGVSTKLAKSGLAEGTVSPTIDERGGGWYEVTPLAAHRDTLGESAWTFSATGVKDAIRLEEVVAFDSQDGANMGLSQLEVAAAVLANVINVTDNSDGTFDYVIRNSANSADLITLRVTPATGDRSIV
ncbi:MAG: hypothetical protein KDB00_10840 [Planctomycetales bacterium]|nr:hypothetical protein [Planctomycetales bacterium]